MNSFTAKIGDTIVLLCESEYILCTMFLFHGTKVACCPRDETSKKRTNSIDQ